MARLLRMFIEEATSVLEGDCLRETSSQRWHICRYIETCVCIRVCRNKITTSMSAIVDELAEYTIVEGHGN
uniref:Secreted protein n=1 Tax=Panagrellus redivivus TaxID=6233 RepID=A0A7E4VKY4_PANRE